MAYIVEWSSLFGSVEVLLLGCLYLIIFEFCLRYFEESLRRFTVVFLPTNAKKGHEFKPHQDQMLNISLVE